MTCRIKVWFFRASVLGEAIRRKQQLLEPASARRLAMATVNYISSITANSFGTRVLDRLTSSSLARFVNPNPRSFPYSSIPSPPLSSSHSLFSAQDSSSSFCSSHGLNRKSSTALGAGPQAPRKEFEIEGKDSSTLVGELQRLGNKEKKELRAYAHRLGTKLNVQQVGKLAVSQTVITSISDALEAHEIVKVKVLENCGTEMDEIMVELERHTRGQVVGKIGRTVLLYRASLKKMAAAAEKERRPAGRNFQPRNNRVEMSERRNKV